MTDSLPRRVGTAVLFLLAFIGCLSIIGLGYLWLSSGQSAKQSGVTQSKFHAATRGGKRLKQATNGKAVPKQYFRGPDGLIGIVGKNKKSGHQFIAWASPHGKALISGPVVTSKGNLTRIYTKKLTGGSSNDNGKGANSGNIQSHQSQSQTNIRTSDRSESRHQAQTGGKGHSINDGRGNRNHGSSKHGSTPKAVKRISSRLFARVKSHALPLVGTNKNAPILYMFEDPSCEHCEKALSNLKPMVKHGKVRLGVVPVGILSTLGVRGAAALVAHPAKRSVFTNSKKLARKPFGKQALKKVKHNRTLLKHVAGMMATPVFVYETQTGSYKRHIGNPKKLKELIDSIKHD